MTQEWATCLRLPMPIRRTLLAAVPGKPGRSASCCDSRIAYWGKVEFGRQLSGALVTGRPRHQSNCLRDPASMTEKIRPTAEQARLDAASEGSANWRRWGPYLSERQWGTVREDYSPQGASWEYVPHDHARSRAYRWGEDGLAGISD